MVEHGESHHKSSGVKGGGGGLLKFIEGFADVASEAVVSNSEKVITKDLRAVVGTGNTGKGKSAH